MAKLQTNRDKTNLLEKKKKVKYMESVLDAAADGGDARGGLTFGGAQGDNDPALQI